MHTYVANDNIELSSELERVGRPVRVRVHDRRDEHRLHAKHFVGLVRPSSVVPDEQRLRAYEVERIMKELPVAILHERHLVETRKHRGFSVKRSR